MTSTETFTDGKPNTTVSTTRATTTLATTTTPQKTVDNDMSSGGIAGVTIGVVVAVSVIVAVLMLLILRHRHKRKRGADEYNKTIHNLKIDKLPSPSEVESAEIRPPTRKATSKPEIESDFGSSIHYQNVPNRKYENLNPDDDAEQPVYLEPLAQQDKRIYTTGEGSEYYVVDSLKKGLTEPALPSRDDANQNITENVNGSKAKTKNKKGKKKVKSNPKQNVNKTTTSQTIDSAKTNTETNDGSDTDNEQSIKSPLHSAKDYINLKDQKITPPKVIAKGPTIPIIDDVYENEEMPAVKTKR